MSALEWNAGERARREADAQPAAQQRAQEDAQRQKELRAELPFWRAQLAAHEEALPRWREEHQRRSRAQDEALLAYRAALHPAVRGELPRAATGELIEVIDLEGAHPDAVASRPARAQWEAFKRAQQETIRAADVLRRLEDAVPKLKYNVTVCERAGVR